MPEDGIPLLHAQRLALTSQQTRDVHAMVPQQLVSREAVVLIQERVDHVVFIEELRVRTGDGCTDAGEQLAAQPFGLRQQPRVVLPAWPGFQKLLPRLGQIARQCHRQHPVVERLETDVAAIDAPGPDDTAIEHEWRLLVLQIGRRRRPRHEPRRGGGPTAAPTACRSIASLTSKR